MSDAKELMMSRRGVEERSGPLRSLPRGSGFVRAGAESMSAAGRIAAEKP